MSIVLINPTIPPRIPSAISAKVTENKGYISPSGEYMYPYSLVFLSSYLAKNGYSSEIIDLNMTTETNMYKFLADTKPAVVGVTAVTQNRFHVIDLIKQIRSILKNTFIVVGGRHFSYTAESALRAVPEIDLVVRGEGEITFFEVVKSLKEKEPLDSVLGITYRDNEHIVQTFDRPHEMDLDKLVIDRQFLPKGGYSDLLTMRNYEKERIRCIPMQLGRGCTQNCVFCVHRFMKYRMRTLRSVMDEIEYCIKKYNTRCFSFNDPSIYCNPGWMYNFCDELLRKDLGIIWYCEGRIDVPLDLLRLMDRAGCRSLDLGIESAVPKVLKSIRKNIDPSMFLPYVKLAKKLEIRSKLFYMISLPDETQEDALATLKLAKQLGRYTYKVGCGLTYIFPGTILESIAVERGLFPKEFDWYDRSYDNHLPSTIGARSDCPAYIEHLDIDFIEKMKRRYYFLGVKMAVKNGDFMRIATEAFKKKPSVKEFVKGGLRIMRGAI